MRRLSIIYQHYIFTAHAFLETCELPYQVTIRITRKYNCQCDSFANERIHHEKSFAYLAHELICDVN